MKTKSLQVLYFIWLISSICNNIAGQGERPTPKTINICSNIYDEFAPSLSADGRTLVFQSNKDGEYKLYESKLQANGNWSDPLPITEINNFGKAKDLVAGPNISYDGNTLFFCASYDKGLGNLDIYYSVRNGDTWSKPTNLGKPVNSSEYEGFPSISSDGNKLYFTRLVDSKQDGMECFKIMVTQKDSKGKWSMPKELPAPINMGCDKAPRIMSDNKTIIFSSIRDGGKGKFDLYTSKMNDAGEWSTPLGMDFVNGPDLEQYATVAASGDYMFYHLNNNIVSVSIPFLYRQNKNITVQGKITDLDTKNPIEATIVVRDAGTTEILSTTTNNPTTGKYTVILTAGKKYEIEFSKPGYSKYILEYDLINLKEYKEYEANVELFSKINYELSIIDQDLYFPINNAEIIWRDGASNEILDLKYKTTKSGSKIYEFKLGNKYVIEVKAPKYAEYKFTLDLSSDIRYKEIEKVIELSVFKKQIIINVTDLELGSGLPVDLLITNLDMDEVIEVQATLTRDGKHALNLREGSRYNVEVKNPKGYAYYNTTIDVNKQGGNLNIALLGLRPNAKLLLKDIIFEFNSYELKDVSFEEINRVIKLMKDNPNMTVEVAAHTDNIGSEGFNKRLSDKRAKFVVEYMNSHNIPSNRLNPNGYGKSAPIAPNDTEENRAKNRRLELKIISN